MTSLTKPLTIDEQKRVTEIINDLYDGTPEINFLTQATAIQLVRHYPAMYAYLREQIQQNSSVITAALKTASYDRVDLPESVRNNKEIMLKVISLFSASIDLIGDKLKKDKSFWVSAVLLDGWNFHMVPHCLKTIEFVKEVIEGAVHIEEFNYMAMSCSLTDALQDDETVMQLMVSHFPRCAWYASYRLKEKNGWYRFCKD